MRHGVERANPAHGDAERVAQGQRRDDAHAQPRERPGPDPDTDGVHVGTADVRRAEHCVDHRGEDLAVPVGRDLGLVREHCSIAHHRDGGRLGRGVEGQDEHERPG